MIARLEEFPNKLNDAEMEAKEKVEGKADRAKILCIEVVPEETSHKKRQYEKKIRKIRNVTRVNALIHYSSHHTVDLIIIVIIIITTTNVFSILEGWMAVLVLVSEF